jgi:hypothetical protein
MKQSRTAPLGATSSAERSPPEQASSSDAPSATPDAPPPPSLIFRSPDGIDAWLAAARAAVLDLLAAAREGARRPRKRVLSRAEIRRQAREAFAGASALLDEAAEALREAAPHVPKR